MSMPANQKSNPSVSMIANCKQSRALKVSCHSRGLGSGNPESSPSSWHRCTCSETAENPWTSSALQLQASEQSSPNLDLSLLLTCCSLLGCRQPQRDVRTTGLPRGWTRQQLSRSLASTFEPLGFGSKVSGFACFLFV